MLSVLLFLLLLLLPLLIAITAYAALLLLSPTPLTHSFSETQYTSAAHPPANKGHLARLQDRPECGLTVVVPAYNERERLPRMVDEAMRFLIDHIKTAKQQEGERWWKGGAEVLIVDDGSTDDTVRVAEALASTWEKEGGQVGVEVRVVQLERNRGKGGAVRHGVLFSRGRRILFADADGASTFADLTLLQRAMDKLLDSPTSNGHAVVVGSRAHMVNSDAVVKRSFLRNLLMRAFHIFLRTLGVRGVKDTQCGFKLFTRTTARTLFPTLHLHRWSFDVELLLLAQILRLPIAEVSIRWHEVPGSKINVGWDGLGMARDLVVLRGNLALGRWVVPKVVMNDEEEEEKVER